MLSHYCTRFNFWGDDNKEPLFAAALMFNQSTTFVTRDMCFMNIPNDQIQMDPTNFTINVTFVDFSSVGKLWQDNGLAMINQTIKNVNVTFFYDTESNGQKTLVFFNTLLDKGKTNT